MYTARLTTERLNFLVGILYEQLHVLKAVQATDARDLWNEGVGWFACVEQQASNAVPRWLSGLAWTPGREMHCSDTAR